MKESFPSKEVDVLEKNAAVADNVKIEEGVKENLEKFASPDEVLATEALKQEKKEDPQVKHNKLNALREKVMGLFKSKTIAEETDIKKLERVAEEDFYRVIGTIERSSSGVGGVSIVLNKSTSELIEKYGLTSKEDKQLFEDLAKLKNEASQMQNGPEKVAKLEEVKRKTGEIGSKMHQVVEKRKEELASSLN